MTEFAYDFQEDTASLLRDAEQKQKNEMIEDGKEANFVPLDIALKDEPAYKVHYDENGRAWDAYMTKVDLRNGPYGEYLFYKLQMVYDTNRDLYIVLTRYGAIYETGMNQRTPFTDLEEAKKEFSTIFKQKSGNEWETAEENFVSQKKKYTLVKVHYTNVKHQDYLAPFDFENCAKTESIDSVIEDLIEEISNVTMY